MNTKEIEEKEFLLRKEIEKKKELLKKEIFINEEMLEELEFLEKILLKKKNAHLELTDEQKMTHKVNEKSLKRR